MPKKSFLDRIEIPRPCVADWERMVGTEQIRFCQECNKHVYNLSGMTRGEAEALVASAPKGRLCARLTRQADGTTVTIDEQPGAQLIWRRASPIANAVVSAMLTMAMPGMAGVIQIETQGASIASAIAGPDDKPDLQGSAGVLAGTLFDVQRSVIVGGKIELVNEDTGEVRTTTSSGDGSFHFFVSGSNLYTLTAGANGFASVATSGLRPGAHIDIKLAPAVVTMGGAMGVPVLSLRDLYNHSDRIVVARAGRSVKIKSGPESYLIRTSLNVSTTLKGEDSEAVINVYRYGYGDQQDSFPQDESILVFLKHRGANGAPMPGGGYELADFSRGLRKLTSAELDVYVQRIRELAQLSLGQKPDQEALVEWLVRCAENPATRWEGAFDLAVSARELRERRVQDNSEEVYEESDSSEEDDVESGEVEGDSTKEQTEYAGELGEYATFAALLTADQKARLVQALLGTPEMTEGNQELIELVKDFHDPRLLPFLVSWLRRTEDNPPVAARTIVRVVAELLSDKRITALAERYKDAPNDDEDEDTNEDSDLAKTQSAPARERSAQMRLFLQQVDRTMRGRNPGPEKN